MVFQLPRKKWSKPDWSQIKNLTKVDLIRMLDKDDRWEFVGIKGALYMYHNGEMKAPWDYVTIHYHPREGFRNKGLLQQLLDQICWLAADIKRLR